MLIPRINRVDPDKIFAIVRNFEASALVDGDVVQWAITGETATGLTLIPGKDVRQSDGVTDYTLAGVMSVAKASLAAGSYGLCQIYGYHAGVKTAVTAADSVLTAGAAGNGVVHAGYGSAIALGNSTITETALCQAILGVILTTGDGTKAGVMIKCMGQ